MIHPAKAVADKIVVFQGYRIIQGDRLFHGFIKLFIERIFLTHWNQYGFVSAARHSSLKPKSSRYRCQDLIRFLERRVYVILGDARSRITLLVKVLLLSAVTHHALVRVICLRVCHLRLGGGYLAAARGA